MKKGKGFAQRVLAVACSTAMAVALVPAAAFGAEGTSGDTAAGDTEAATVLKVQTEAVDAEGNAMSDAVDVKSYTQADLDALAAANTTAQHYEYAGRRGATVVTTSKYVTIDQLATDAGVTQWASGSSLSFVCSDGEYTKAYPTYDDVSVGYYYPNYTVSEYDATGAVSVPAAIALTSKKDTITSGTTAADTVAASTAAEGTGDDAPMFVAGTTQTTYAGKAVSAGSAFPTGVNTITIKYQPSVTIETQAVDAEGNAMSDPIAVKSYTLSDLDTMSKANTTTLNYEWRGHSAGGAGTLMTTSKYVTVDQLMSDAGVSQWAEGASLGFECYDGPYGKYTASYNEAKNGYYYPSYTATEYDATGATAVPAVVALTLKTDSIQPGTKASEVAANSTKAETTEGAPRYAMGTLQSTYQKNDMNMGRTFPSGVNTIIVKYQPTVTVRTQLVDDSGNAVGTPTTAKTYTLAQLSELAKSNTSTLNYVYSGRSGATAVSTSSYVTLDQLMKDAGVTQWVSGSSLSFICSDGEYTKAYPTYDDATAGYYYPNYSVSEYDATGAVSVPAALTLTSKKTRFAAGTTAADAVASSTEAESSEGSPMFAMGTTQATYSGKAVNAGRDFPTGVTTITVNYKQGVTPTPTPSVTKVANTVKVAKAKVTVKKGKKATVKVTKAQGTVTVKSSNKKIAKVSYSKKTKKVTIKGVKKGKATITVKAAGNSKYKAGKKTIKVTVKK